MKICDTAICCGPHELDLLFLKLTLEQECVNEWVLIENEYDYRGRKKGYFLKEALKQERFGPFRERITVFAESFCLGRPDEEKGYDPQSYAEMEWRLRDAPTKYILNKYAESDRVLVTDVDELFDFSSPARRDKIFGAFKQHSGPIQFDRVRYIYDFDNHAKREEGDMISPSYTINDLRTGRAKLRDKKWIGELVRNEDKPAVFEYCFCFPYDAIWYKLSTSLHTLWDEDELRRSLRCNYWTQRGGGQPDQNCRWHWFERVGLTPDNSPDYVREHFDELKTGLVPINYRENRLKEFGFKGYQC